MSAAPPQAHVTRIARRRARVGFEVEYEALIREMFEAMRQAPGFLGAQMITPEQPGGDYQVIAHFRSEADLKAWDESPARAALQPRLCAAGENEPEYRVVTGLEAWFGPQVVAPSTHPPRARMALVTWMGIFPTVSLFLWLVAPLLTPLPFLPRVALLTALIVITMTWVVMPRLTRLMRGFLNPAAGG
jgi:antibiotic biosynthesis monooxygenase (ABM) superfamily enzyme